MDLAAAFARHLRTSGLLRPGDRVLVACSGGADSVALLRLLLPLRGTAVANVSAAHLDHGLRAGSADDARFVESLCEALGVELDVACVRVRKRRGESPEEAARRVRYAFLAHAARRLGANVVATAHHLDDQAETVLYRVLRGTGIDGLRGILPATEIAGVRVVRPLLPFRREALREWLRGAGHTWREDPTNAAGNDRALLRNEVLPLARRLLRRDPAPPLARLADHARREPPSPRPAEPAPLVPARPPAVTWERRSLDTVALLERLRSSAGAVELLDAAQVTGRLRLRAPRSGDRLHALGMPAPQRLTHYLQRRGVLPADRRAVRLLCDDAGIVCVAGHGIAARVALTSATESVVVVRTVPESSGPPLPQERRPDETRSGD